MSIRQTVVAVNLVAISFLALTAEQLSHEICHGVMALIVGARWVRLFFWASLSEWPGAEPESVWPDALISGSAAILNIVFAVAAILLLKRRTWPQSTNARLFIFYFAAYSLNAGFGYIFFDPLFANPDSTGDWAKIVNLLGGSWLTVRLPLIAMGATGIIYGYFWMGSATLDFRLQGASPKRVAGLLCLVPYVATNLIFTLLALGHPLGVDGFIISSIKLWFGFCGFFWAYMINFVWRPVPQQREPGWPLATELTYVPLALALSVLVLIIFVLLPGIPVAG